jgi:hypothetical protein
VSDVLREPVTARAFLLGGTGGDDDAQLISRALAEQNAVSSWGLALARLSGSAQGAVRDEVAASAAGVLDLDLGDVLIAGWRKHRDLVEAARQTAAAPAESTVVPLLSHRVTSAHHPAVEVLVDGVRIHTVRMDLTLAFGVDAVVAVVRQGWLVELRSGTATVSGELCVEGVPLVRRKLTLDLPGVLRIGSGIPLLQTAQAHPAVAAS